MKIIHYKNINGLFFSYYYEKPESGDQYCVIENVYRRIAPWEKEETTISTVFESGIKVVKVNQ